MRRKLLYSFSALVILGAVVWNLLPEIYRLQENRNFKRLEEAHANYQSGLDCTVLPVHCAVRDKKYNSLPEIISEGFPHNAQDEWGKTALLFVFHNSPQIDLYKYVELLLKAGVDPNIGDGKGEFPLTYALRTKNFELAKLLISKGANPNLKVGPDKKKVTLLTQAISYNDVVQAQFLVEQGADLNIEDDYGYKPCERAKTYQSTHLFRFCQ